MMKLVETGLKPIKLTMEPMRARPQRPARPLRMTWDCSSFADEFSLPRTEAIKAKRTSNEARTFSIWRRGRESNPSRRLCRPLHNRFATSPEVNCRRC